MGPELSAGSPVPGGHRVNEARPGEQGPRKDVGSAAEHRLIRQVASGDSGALARLMELYWHPLHAYVTRTFRWGPDEADDIVQETFVRVWELRQWDPGRGTVRAFLYQVTRNLVLEALRREEVRSRLDPQVVERTPQPGTPWDSLRESELQTALLEALASLPPRRREALILVRFQGLSLQEVASLMGLGKQTVANHVTMALDDLRRHLGSALG